MTGHQVIFVIIVTFSWNGGFLDFFLCWYTSNNNKRRDETRNTKNKRKWHRRTGPVSFRGAEIRCLNIFSIVCPKIKWFCPNITCFLPENCYLKNSRGLQPPASPSPASYAYGKWYIVMLYNSTKWYIKPMQQRQNNYSWMHVQYTKPQFYEIYDLIPLVLTISDINIVLRCHSNLK